MKVLFDQGTPAPLRMFLVGHEVTTVYELGWAEIKNGELLAAAEPSFDVFITTDKNLRYQQNLAGRRIAILVLPTTSWPKVKERTSFILVELNQMQAGQYREITFS